MTSPVPSVRHLDDAAIERLRRVVDAPDLAASKYEIVRELGRGGMGTVYEVYDRELGRVVAMKVVTSPETMTDALARLEREARTLAGLEHPGLVPVHDIGTLPDGRVYYTMKLVRGRPLDDLAPDMSRGEVLRLFLRLGDAVSFAHAHGVVHRDLKPQNVMVGTYGEVLVVDWGLAATTGIADQGLAVGTPGYMSPEQARGDAVDARSDVYSLGVLLRWMLESVRDRVPRPLLAICAKATASDPANRYATAGELTEDVVAFVNRRPVAAYAEPVWERAARIVSKYRMPIGLVLAYLLMRVMFILASRR